VTPSWNWSFTRKSCWRAVKRRLRPQIDRQTHPAATNVAVSGPGLTGIGAYGIALTNDACSEASVTQALLRFSPRIAPVTLRT
jgi:hypothetical protein